MSKSNKNDRRPDRFKPLRDATRDRDIRATRHVVKQILKDGEFEELEVLDEPKLEKEE